MTGSQNLLTESQNLVQGYWWWEKPVFWCQSHKLVLAICIGQKMTKHVILVFVSSQLSPSTLLKLVQELDYSSISTASLWGIDPSGSVTFCLVTKRLVSKCLVTKRLVTKRLVSKCLRYKMPTLQNAYITKCLVLHFAYITKRLHYKMPSVTFCLHYKMPVLASAMAP